MGLGETKEPGRVRRMFDGIAGRYDLLNHLLSLNLDRRWRRAAAAAVPAEQAVTLLDLCGGTGDLTLALARAHPTARLICCDFSHQMLLRAQPKFRRHKLGAACLCVEADGLLLPFPAGTFDAVTVGFGVRNFVDLDRGLREIHRVLVPGGRLVVLEFSRPSGGLLGSLYAFYLRHLLPGLGDRVSGSRGPYGYLARTIADFTEPPRLAGQVREAGFAACGWSRLSGGIVALHTALKAGPSRG